MAVTDANGEISASIEETNRVRASLGLKPLAEENGSGGGAAASKEAEAKARGAERAAAMAKEGAEDALRDKLDSARRQRLLHQKLTGKSLGEQLVGEEMDSVAAWVGKHQGQEETRKEKRKEMKAQRKAQSSLASRSARYDDEDAMGMGLGLGLGGDDEPPSELAGATVGHSVDDFKAGESVVLTLADQAVLGAAGEGCGYALNEDEEMLENVNLSEDYRRRKAKAEAAGEGYKYNPYGADGSGKDAGFGGTGGVLGKYDDAAERTTIRLDASGGVDEARQKKLAAIKARLAATQAGATGEAHDLSNVGAVRTIADGDDYMSREEVRKEEEAASALFRKKTDGERKEKKKRLRKKPKAEGLDLDALAAMTAAEGGNDLGSKASREARLGEREAAATDLANAKKERFDRALAKADARSRAMEHEGTMPTSTPMEVEGGDNNGGMEEEEEEAEVDVELYAALSRARRLTAKKEQQEQHTDDLAAQRVAATLAKADAARQAMEAEGNNGMEEGIEFSETGEFCKAVRAKDEMDNSADLPSVKFRESLMQREEGGGGTQSSAVGPRGGAPSSYGGKSSAVKREVKEEGDDGNGEDGRGDEEGDGGEEDDDEQDGSSAPDFMYERHASGGLGAVLDIARNRGLLGKEDSRAGRMFDEKAAGLHRYEEAAVDAAAGTTGKEPSFVLEHYDEYGRKMTAKQAFRQLSWKFHGKAPSKKNREKRMLEVEKSLAEQSEDKAMGYMHALQAAQQSTKSAHVVLTGIHAIKPSEVKAARQAAGGDEPKKKKAKAAI